MLAMQRNFAMSLAFPAGSPWGNKKAGGARTEFAVPMPAIGTNMKEA